MKFNEVYRQGLKRLSDNNIENSAFDNRLIFENCFNMDRTALAISGENYADDERVNKFFKDIEKRIGGEPLQYILGKWEFKGLTFKVGKGVLIPREETELLVDLALEWLNSQNEHKVVFDLCAGSGCVGISVAKNCKNCDLYLIEKSPDAMKYLMINGKESKLENIKIVQGDIKDGFEAFDLPNPDIILSNPPYIKTDDIGTLQKEVRSEPQMALDGGQDGLDFYKIIIDKWAHYLSNEGMIAVEIGDEQHDEVFKLFSKHFKNVFKIFDFNKINRVIKAYNEKKVLKF